MSVEVKEVLRFVIVWFNCWKLCIFFVIVWDLMVEVGKWWRLECFLVVLCVVCLGCIEGVIDVFGKDNLVFLILLLFVGL